MICKLENIFASMEEYNCFACGPKHPFGLRLEFYYDDEKHEAFTAIKPDALFAGFPGILHGGIQVTILDETAFWGTWARYGRSGFTFELKTRFRKKCPVGIDLEARAEVCELNHKFVTSNVYLWDPASLTIYTDGSIRYFLPDGK